MLDEWLRANLICPRDHGDLEDTGGGLACAAGHFYPVRDGIPVMLVDDLDPTHRCITRSMEEAREETAEPEESTDGVDAFVQRIVAATGGYLYRPLVGKLTRYPIPEMPLPAGEGKRLLDVGCNWGRWTVAAERRGYRAVGIDPSLPGIRAARRVARDLGVDPLYVVGDARRLPFRARIFDRAFSYSVLQHFSRENVRRALDEIARVLVPGGESLVQMPNRFGVRSLYWQARRGFREGIEFDVRYWSPGELAATFDNHIGPTRLTVDGYFSLNPQPADADLLPTRLRWVVRASDTLRRASERFPPMRNVADSLYVHSRRDFV